jgi:hypothetical protein
MSYKLASKLRLRFLCPKGNLTTEQLWELSIDELDELAVSLDTEHKTSGKKSFIGRSSEKDKTLKLKFDVVLDVLNTKVEEEEEATQAYEDKQYNEKLLTLIIEKQDESLKGKSVKQLQAMMR